jgi:hypothetical protein
MSKRYRLGMLAVVLVAGSVLAGDLTPPGPPGATMRTLQEIYDKLNDIDAKIGGDAGVPRTGQATSYRTGDDGDLQKGVAWPDPRFTDHGNGTVTDNLTGLMWVKEPHGLDGNSGGQTWNNAIDFCNGLNYAGHSDWRLPNVRELHSLIDYERSLPPLPSGHPFTGVQSDRYWSSSTLKVLTASAWSVTLHYGTVDYFSKSNTYRVWPVRAGQ